MLDKVDNSIFANHGGSRDLAVAADSDEVSEYSETVVRDISKPRRTMWYYLGRFILSILQAVLMIAVLVAAYFATKRMIAEKPEPRKRPAFKTVYTVETMTAKKQDHQPVFVSYGQTIAARSVDLRPLVAGEIVKVNEKLRAGARVAKGEALVEIDDFEYTGALAESRANLEEAKARIGENEAQITLEKSRLTAASEQLGFAIADLERVNQLKQRGTSTQKEVEARRLLVSQRKQAVSLAEDTIKVQQSRVAQIKASIDRLQWRVEQAERNLASTTLVAPFSGIVLSSSAELGRTLSANDVVVSLYEADTLEVKFTLTDAQYGRLQTAQSGFVGRNVEVIWTVGGEQYVYPAKIDRVGAEITSNRGGVELYALVEKSDNTITIRPGAFVEVRVPDKKFADVVSIPDISIYGTNTVYVERGGKLVQREVKIAAFEGERALVSSGLDDGDEVLVTRITEVSEGLSVRREGEAAPQKTADGNRKTGRPDRAEIAAILKKNQLTREQWQAMARPERRKLIAAHRAGQ